MSVDQGLRLQPHSYYTDTGCAFNYANRQLVGEQSKEPRPQMTSFDRLYAAVRPMPSKSSGCLREEPSSKMLQSQLFPFQRKALAFMLTREQQRGPEQLHSLWQELQLLDGNQLYSNLILPGLLTTTRFIAPHFQPGGILAEEVCRCCWMITD